MATIQDVFSHIYTTEAQLGDVPVKNGQIILCTDSEKLYIDHGTTRVSTSDVVQVDNQEALPLAPLDKLYITKDTGDIFFYINGAWEKINQSDISVGNGLTGNGTSSSPIKLDLSRAVMEHDCDINAQGHRFGVSLLNEVEISATSIALSSDSLTLTAGNVDIFTTEEDSLFIDASQILLNRHNQNAAGGFAVVDLTTGKLPIGIIPDVTGNINIDNYTSNSTIRLTSTAGAVNLISNTGEVGLYSGNTAHIKANVDTVDLKGTTLAFNGNDQNTAGGVVVLDGNGKIPTTLYDQAEGGLTSVNTGSATNTGLTGDGTASSPISLDLSNYGTRNAISLTTFGGFTFKISAATAMSINTDANVHIATHTYLAENPEANVYFHGNATNTANGLVVLGADGKVPSSLLPEMSQSWTKVTINQSSFATSDDTYGGSYYELNGICSVEVYDANGYKVEFDVKCDFTNSKTRIYIPSGLTADTISNWTLLYLAKSIA